MSEMVEKVARAMWDAREATLPERVRQPFSENLTGDIFVMARAAIAAMREPTEAMLEAPYFGEDPLSEIKHHSMTWRAMIDEALK